MSDPKKAKATTKAKDTSAVKETTAPIVIKDEPSSPTRKVSIPQIKKTPPQMSGSKIKNCEFIIHVGLCNGLPQVVVNDPAIEPQEESKDTDVFQVQTFAVQKAFVLNPLLLHNTPISMQATVSSPKEEIILPSTGSPPIFLLH